MNGILGFSEALYDKLDNEQHKKMGGTISIQSNKGDGSLFTIELPRIKNVKIKAQKKEAFQIF